MTTTHIFPSRLRELRKAKGLTQTELGEKVGVKQNTFTNWENGKREPSFEKLFLLAEYLDTSTDYLLGKTDKSQRRYYNDGEEGIDYTIDTLLVLFGEEGTLNRFNATSLEEVREQVRQTYKELNAGDISTSNFGNTLETIQSE